MCIFFIPYVLKSVSYIKSCQKSLESETEIFGTIKFKNNSDFKTSHFL